MTLCLFTVVMGRSSVMAHCYDAAITLHVDPDTQAAIAAYCIGAMFSGRAGVA